jgi:cytochrome P450 family 6
MVTEILFSFSRPLAKAGNPIDVREAMARFALDVIGKCAFGLQFNTLSESDNLYREVGKTLNEGGLKNSFRMLLQFINPNLLKLFGMKMTSDEVEHFFFNLLHGAEEVRRKEPEHRGDFLQLMLDLKDENGNKVNRKLFLRL